MAQIRWVYASPTCRQYAIGLYHGDRNKHVILHINNNISIIDFYVKEDKVYSFFIEDQLCELHMRRGESNWHYDFKINRTVDTPANKARRKIEKRHLLYTLTFLLLFVSLVIVLTMVFF